MASEIHVIAEPDRGRAIFTLALVALFPFIFAWGLSYSGHHVSDYFDLIRTGRLSAVRQGVMWISVIAFALLYVRPSIIALRGRTYIATDPEFLILPTAAKVRLDSIDQVTARAGFWQKLLVVETSEGTRRYTITYAKGGAEQVRNALRADPRLERALDVPA